MSRNLAKAIPPSEPWVERRASAQTGTKPRVPILICGDQPLYRAALTSLIERDPHFVVIAESSNDVGEVLEAFEQQEEDVQMVIIDYDVAPATGRTIDALETLLDTVVPRPTLLVSSGLDSQDCQRVMRHGISGILFKANGADVLLAAIESAQNGQVWLDRELLPQIFDDSHTRRMTCSQKPKIDRLTPREREIITVACTGITNKQIANKLSISEATVRHHLGSIFSKLGVSTRSELVVYGYRHRLAQASE